MLVSTLTGSMATLALPLGAFTDSALLTPFRFALLPKAEQRGWATRPDHLPQTLSLLAVLACAHCLDLCTHLISCQSGWVMRLSSPCLSSLAGVLCACVCTCL